MLSYMGLYINSNLVSIKIQRQLTTPTRSLSRSFERLSSGLRIKSIESTSTRLTFPIPPPIHKNKSIDTELD